jgi:hypothetical protein
MTRPHDTRPLRSMDAFRPTHATGGVTRTTSPTSGRAT